jgi:hypothetical protein
VTTLQESHSDTGEAFMKIMALFTAPLSYLYFSNRTPGKGAISTKKNKSQAKKPTSTKTNNQLQLKPFRGTSVVFEECACDAVKAIGKQRFLVAKGDIPMLPLSSCDASRCNCKYMHHDDRREDDDDRRLSAALKTELYEDTGNSNRRTKKRGRRESDF